MVVSHWSLVVGRWSLVIGRWSLVIGRWSLVVGRWSLVVSPGGDDGRHHRRAVERFRGWQDDAASAHSESGAGRGGGGAGCGGGSADRRSKQDTDSAGGRTGAVEDGGAGAHLVRGVGLPKGPGLLS